MPTIFRTDRAPWSRRLARGVLSVALGAWGASASAETLGDAIALAYESNPTLQGQRASLRALDESYVQAEAGYRPTANLQATVTNDSNNNTNPYTRSLPGLSQQIINGQSETSGAAIGLTQPIYTGGRVATQISAAQASILAGRETVRGSEETILREVITAYADVRRDQQVVTILETGVTLLMAQLDEARARFAVGDITRTDVAETEARVAAARAELAQAKTQLGNSRAQYASVVGRNPGDLTPEPPLTKHLPESLDAAFDRAERNAPPIRQADFTEQSSAAKLAQAKTQTRPTLSVQATVGYTGGNYNVVATPFSHYSHDLNIAAVLTIPLFSGGATSSQIRQAAETNNADRIGIEAARRQALLSVSQAWNGLTGARASVDANDAQVTAANIAYEGARQEARVGLRSTLDVLIAEQTLAAAQVALVNARHDEYVAAADLLSATGTLYAQDFAPDVRIYDMKANLKHAEKVWPWAPWTPALAGLDGVGAPKIKPTPAPPPGEH